MMQRKSKRLRFIVAPKADVDIGRRDLWWQDNRKDSPKLFGKALRQALKDITAHPGLGTRFVHEAIDGVRWYPLRGTNHLLFYVVIHEPPLPACLAVLGIQGPGQDEPPDLAAARMSLASKP